MPLPLAIELVIERLDALRVRAVRVSRDGHSVPPIALAVAAGFHVLALWVAAGGLAALLVAVGVATGPDEDVVGDPAGKLDGIGAEIIDAAELDKRYLSFGKGQGAVESETAATATRSSEPPPVSQQPADETPIEKADLPAPAPAPRPTTPPRPQPQPTTTISQAEIDEIVAATRPDANGAVFALSAGSEARLGNASEYVRSVLRVLKREMPRSIGVKGSVVLQFIVSPTGDIQQIRLAQSSGRPELDRHVFERVRTTHLVAPAATTPKRERMFQITYEYN